jgi:hypothetical protein
MKSFNNKTVYLNDIVQYQYTTPLATNLEMIRSYDQSVLNCNNLNSKNYYILCDFKKDKKIISKSTIYK